jgi:D-tyrosyl-tRNA(Tyr) deacylase
MKALIQRVKAAQVREKETTLGKIGKGMLVFLGVEKGDTKEKAENLAKKILNLRIFPSKEKDIDLSIEKIKGDILVVSQFTLCADLSKGNRPSFINAATPDLANEIYLHFIKFLKENSNLKVETGKFGAMMEVELINDGPVTIMLEN